MNAEVPCVVDTNVFAIAAEMTPTATEECVAACSRVLVRVTDGYPLLVDAGDEILEEYVSTLATASKSGLATKLVLHLYRTRNGNPACRKVGITPIDDPVGSYSEVPVALRDFDLDDQKFIAVASSGGGTSPIIAGLDGEWWERRADFAANAIDVQFPCIADLM